MSDTPRHDAPESATGAAPNDHALSIEQTSARFLDAGVPRSVRTVQRYCQVGYLNCISVQGELGSRYIVSVSSVENRITELHQIQQIMGAPASAPRRVGTRDDTAQRDTARNSATESARGEIGVADLDPTEIKRLRDTIQLLEIDKRVRDELISRIDRERERLLTQVIDKSRTIGKLETELRLLRAPSAIADNAEMSSPDSGV